jgi:redox-sensitive bicupin YhaK (pirin superfamily)
MVKNTQIRKIIRNKPLIDFAEDCFEGIFGNGDTAVLDPFLLLDVLRSDEPRYFLKSFPSPPNRHVETVSYMYAGEVDHCGSSDNKDVGRDDIDEFATTCSGSIRRKIPKNDATSPFHGFQLWANLPASHKMRDPRYRDIPDNTIPSVSVSGGATIKVIAGIVNGTVGPMQGMMIDSEYLDVTVPPHSEFTHCTMAGQFVFAYVINGSVQFCKETTPSPFEVEDADLRQDRIIGNATLVLFDDGERVFVQTEDDSVRFLLVSGKPIGKPVAWYGPIVMNTREEFQPALQAFDSTPFVNHERTNRFQQDKQ